MKRAVKICLALLLTAIAAVPQSAGAWGKREVNMQAIAPELNVEVFYRRTWDGGKKSEIYAVHAEALTVAGVPAYQSISIYRDRVRRITMRAADLTPIHMSEIWNDGKGLITRSYQGDTVHAVRKNVPEPYDVMVSVPAKVHDPESFAFLLKGYPFLEQDTLAPIDVLVADPNPLFSRPRTLGVNIVLHGKEIITAPVGTLECYVLEMTLSGVLGFIVPDNRFWLLKTDPHLIVKAAGGGELIELVNGPFPCDGKKHCAEGVEPPP